jgi:hypothetical protein
MFILMKTVLEIINRLREKHYSDDFEVKDGKFCSKDSGECFNADDLMIEKVYRYEGDSNPDDNAIVYAITAKNGCKGVLVDSYGTYADVSIAKLIGAIPVREEHELQDNTE